MSDLISRQDAIEAVMAEGRNVDSRYLESERIVHECDAVEALAMLPSADRPTGEWVVHPLASKIEEFADWYVCTACGIGCKRREHGLNNGIPWETVYNYPYCPNCGAKMGGEA